MNEQKLKPCPFCGSAPGNAVCRGLNPCQSHNVWNPVTGCTKVSQGCKHCYAERDWQRLQHLPRFAGRAFTDVVCHPDRLDQPLLWAKPRRIFVNSMSDLFHEDVPVKFIDQVFAVMDLAPRHAFQVLTKRPERMRDYILDPARNNRIGMARARIFDAHDVRDSGVWMSGQRFRPSPNIWLGVSVEDQATADQRITILLQTPAAVRWISAEPLLGPIDLNRLQFLGGEIDDKMSALSGRYLAAYGTKPGAPKLDWVVVGGESGPKARPMNPEWVRSLRDQCAAAVVPFFLKQWGEWAPNCLCSRPDACKTTPRPEPGKPGCMFRCGKKAAGRLLDEVQHDGYPS